VDLVLTKESKLTSISGTYSIYYIIYIFSTIVYVIRWLLRGISLAEYKHSILYGENQEQVFDDEDEDEDDEEQKQTSHLLSKKRRFNVQVLLANQKVMDNDGTITPRVDQKRTKNRNDGMYIVIIVDIIMIIIMIIFFA
jgi:hypothetical protein